MRKHFKVVKQNERRSSNRIARYLYEAKMFCLAIAYVAILAIVASCVLGAMVVAFLVAVLVDTYHTYVNGGDSRKAA